MSDDDAELQREVARRRLEVVEGVLWAIDHAEELLRIGRAAPDRPAAVAALVAEHGLTEFQAQHAMDLTVAHLGLAGRARFAEERERLLREIGG